MAAAGGLRTGGDPPPARAAAHRRGGITYHNGSPAPVVGEVDPPTALAYNQAMSIHLRPDQEAQLQEIAARSGRDASQLAQEWVDDLIDYDSWYRQKVAEGRAQLDRGEFLTHEEVGARLARLFQS